VGTAAWPGLVYVMKDADDVNSNFEVVGSMVILDDWHCEGGMTYTYSSTYIPRLPTYFLQGWSTGTSGTLEFSSWTEVNPDGN
jgi:hypothetical protein